MYSVTKGIIDFLVDLGASDVVCYDDFIVASAESSKHVESIYHDLLVYIKKNNLKKLSVEGLEYNRWILIDLGSVVINIFRPDVRFYYEVDEFWKYKTQENNFSKHF